jgi:hypothetical protein
MCKNAWVHVPHICNTYAYLGRPLDAAFTHIGCLQAVAPILPGPGKGMFGFMVLPGGEVCPPALPAPFDLGEDITQNQVGGSVGGWGWLAGLFEGRNRESPVTSAPKEMAHHNMWHC